MAGVLGAPGVYELGEDMEVVVPRKGVPAEVAWCGALLTEALYGEQSRRPEVAVQQAEEQAGLRERDVCKEEPGCLGWTLHL